METIFKTYKPENFHTVTSYLFATNPVLLIDFLKSAFFAIEINRSINSFNGEIANSIVQIGDTCFMISQSKGQYENIRSAFYLFVDDVDMVHKRAIMYGAKADFEPVNMPYQDRQSGIIDPCGNYWFISKRLVKKGYHD